MTRLESDRRYLLTIALITLTLCLISCITITNTSTGDFDFKDRFDKATKEIVERSIRAEEAALKGQRASVDPKVGQFVQRHFVKADELVLAHMSALNQALGTSSFGNFFNEYASRRSALLSFTLKLQPSLEIVESKFVNATAFPSGKILLNRPLAEAFDGNKDGFDSALLGVLIHELMHIRDGHALEQWATADSRQAWAKDKAIGALSSLTALIPFLSIKYDVQYPLTYKSAKQLPALSEYAADLGTMSLLDEAGFDNRRYVAFLAEMNANIAETAGRSGQSLLRQRVECLGTFSRVRFEEDLRGIVVGSSDAGDSVIQALDLGIYYKAASLLDSPEALAKQFPGKPGTSDADRRSFVLMSIRKSIFTGCAIQHSFPDVGVKEGVMTTPTFDLTMFAQHF